MQLHYQLVNIVLKKLKRKNPRKKQKLENDRQEQTLVKTNVNFLTDQ